MLSLCESHSLSFTHARTHTHMHAHTHACTHARAHTHTHTHTHTFPPSLSCPPDSELVVGFENTAYDVDEIDGYQLACVAVLSGDLDGREVRLSYSTTSGTACTLTSDVTFPYTDKDFIMVPYSAIGNHILLMKSSLITFSPSLIIMYIYTCQVLIFHQKIYVYVIIILT